MCRSTAKSETLSPREPQADTDASPPRRVGGFIIDGDELQYSRRSPAHPPLKVGADARSFIDESDFEAVMSVSPNMDVKNLKKKSYRTPDKSHGYVISNSDDLPFQSEFSAKYGYNFSPFPDMVNSFDPRDFGVMMGPVPRDDDNEDNYYTLHLQKEEESDYSGNIERHKEASSHVPADFNDANFLGSDNLVSPYEYVWSKLDPLPYSRDTASEELAPSSAGRSKFKGVTYKLEVVKTLGSMLALQTPYHFSAIWWYPQLYGTRNYYLRNNAPYQSSNENQRPLRYRKTVRNNEKIGDVDLPSSHNDNIDAKDFRWSENLVLSSDEDNIIVTLPEHQYSLTPRKDDIHSKRLQHLEDSSETSDEDSDVGFGASADVEPQRAGRSRRSSTEDGVRSLHHPLLERSSATAVVLGDFVYLFGGFSFEEQPFVVRYNSSG